MAHICLDSDEKKWFKVMLEKRQKADLAKIDGLFVKHLCNLLDSTIRKHYFLMCYKCAGTEGEHYHICLGQTASVFGAFGSRILDWATKGEIQTAWKEFITDVQLNDVFKRVVFKWLKEFSNIRDEIDKDWDKYTDYLFRHFPNPTQNPHQLYDYDDID
jgi:hypothetical protein